LQSEGNADTWKDCQRIAIGVCHVYEVSGLQKRVAGRGAVDLSLGEGEFSRTHSDSSF